MNEILSNLVNQVKTIFEKTSVLQKIIIGSVVVIGTAALIATLVFSSRKSGVLLFKRAVGAEESKNIIAVLDAAAIKYEYSNGLFYISQSDKPKVELELVKEGKMPTVADGWEIFDTQRIAITDAELDINKRRALTKAITSHLQKLDFIDEATVQLTFPKKEYLTDVDAPVTASVVIRSTSFKDDVLKSKKTVRGLQKLIAMGVDKLKPEFVTISDSYGTVLTDFTDEESDLKIKLAQEELKIVERERKRIEQQIAQTLGKIYKNRVETTISLELIWDETYITNNLIVPTVIKENDPVTPYDESVVVTNVSISQMNISEEWKGQQFVPQGAAGAEENIPAGYKDKTDKWQTYIKNSKTDNFDVSRRFEAIKKGAYQIGRISAAVAIDGRWERLYNENGSPLVTNNNRYQRKYIPVTEDEIKSVMSLVQAAIGYEVRRGDKVSVTHIPFDHFAKFEKEDSILHRQKVAKQIAVISVLTLLSLFVMALVIRVIQKEIARRRRIRDEELERKQMELRRQALLNTRDESVTDMSIEDAARKKLIDEVVRISHERPEDVALLLRTWMVDEK